MDQSSQVLHGTPLLVQEWVEWHAEVLGHWKKGVDS